VGRYRQGHPVRFTYKIAFTMARRGCIKGRPSRCGPGSNGPMTAHSVSDRSDGYRRPGRLGRVLWARAGFVFLVVTHQDRGARASHYSRASHHDHRPRGLPNSHSERTRPGSDQAVSTVAATTAPTAVRSHRLAGQVAVEGTDAPGEPHCLTAAGGAVVASSSRSCQTAETRLEVISQSRTASSVSCAAADVVAGRRCS
jgi:hypothetical protein